MPPLSSGAFILSGKDIQNIALNHLRALTILYQEGSVKAAAERLRITPPAVSYSLRLLREALGDPLFVRTNNGLIPTVRVHAIMDELPGIVNQLDNLLQRSLHFCPTGAGGRLHIAVPQALGGWLIPHLYHRVAQEAPKLTFHSELWSKTTLKQLEREELDIGIHIIDQHPKSLVQRTLAQASMVIICRQEHPLTTAKQVTFDLLAAQPVLIHESSNYSGYVTVVETLFKQQGYKPKVKACIGQLNAAFRLIETSDMIMFGSREFLPEISGSLTMIDTPGEFSDLLKVRAYFHSRQRQNPFYHWLLDIIREEIDRHKQVSATHLPGTSIGHIQQVQSPQSS